MTPDLHSPIPGAPHFTLAELTRSHTARTYGLDNRPGPAQLANLTALAQRVLEPLRRRFGPLLVLSGYRSPELNWYVSLSRTSRHCQGLAADLRPARRGVTLWQMAAYAARYLPVHELIVEYPPAGWLHVSLARPGEGLRLLLQTRDAPLRRLGREELEAKAGLRIEA